jgi:hypothetical protein
MRQSASDASLSCDRRDADERYYRRNMPQTQQREVSPSIIRAWFDTVLNPLLYRLKIEASVLDTGYLTWRFRSRGLVSPIAVRSLLIGAVQDNLDQFLSLHPECVGPIEEHDKGLQLLVDSCRELESRLITSKEMQALFQRLTSPEALGGRDVAEIFRAIRPEDRLKVVVELMINSVSELPGYYSIADFWYVHHAEFLKLREIPAIWPFWKTTYHAAERFLQDVNRLIDVLTKVRNDLSLSAGVPIVESLTR